MCVAASWELPHRGGFYFVGASTSVCGLGIVCGSASCVAPLRVWLRFVCGSASFVLRLCCFVGGFSFVCAFASCVALLCGGSAVWLFCFLGDSASWLLLCFVASALLCGSDLLCGFCSASCWLSGSWGLLLCFVLALACSPSEFSLCWTFVDWIPGLVFVNTTNNESQGSVLCQGSVLWQGADQGVV